MVCHDTYSNTYPQSSPCLQSLGQAIHHTVTINWSVSITANVTLLINTCKEYHSMMNVLAMQHQQEKMPL
jgi:hypothetical protein